jgi:cytochrome c peroxidase
LFARAFDDVSRPSDVTITHIANALGAFVGREWISYDSPFDAYLAGDGAALSAEQKQGMTLFYGEAGCAECHSGPLLTDHEFYAIALPHFGPGRTRRFDPYARDVGRMGESDRLEDAYRFRTPSLRNVALTAPYGHNGAYATLDGIVRHHLDPHDVRERSRLKSKLDIRPRDLSDDEVQALVMFLKSLTGGESAKGRLGKPVRVPSGLRVD